jgi:hypothetical protein
MTSHRSSFYSTAQSPTTSRSHIPSLPLSHSPTSHRTSVGHRYHSRNTSDPHEYRRRPPTSHHLAPVVAVRYDEEDTEDAEEDDEEDDNDNEDTEMTVYSSRSTGHHGNASGSSNGGNSRPGSSSNKDSGSVSKKTKTKSNKVFQCTGYGDCTMQFTRSEHLARHIRYLILCPFI